MHIWIKGDKRQQNIKYLENKKVGAVESEAQAANLFKHVSWPFVHKYMFRTLFFQQKRLTCATREGNSGKLFFFFFALCLKIQNPRFSLFNCWATMPAFWGFFSSRVLRLKTTASSHTSRSLSTITNKGKVLGPFTALRPSRLGCRGPNWGAAVWLLSTPFEGNYSPSIVLGNKLAASLVQVLWAEIFFFVCWINRI